MVTWTRLVSTYVLAFLFCLGIWYQMPIPIPRVKTHTYTESEIKTELMREQRQKAIDKATAVAARLYRSYGCPVNLAPVTAVNALDNGLPPRLVAAVVVVESTCRQHAISKAGAVGYMQVMPAMHHVSRAALHDREINFRVGTQLLAHLVHTYGMEEGVASYFGITPGSDAAWDYAYKVYEVAGYKR